MGYIARVTFADLDDGKRIYLAGTKYPRDGLAVSDERLARLASSDNLMGYPLIVEVDDNVQPKEEKTEAEKLAKPARKRVKTNAD